MLEVSIPEHLNLGKDGNVRDPAGNVYEIYEGAWRKVVNGERSGWWRFNDHYDRHGYCDNPARGY